MLCFVHVLRQICLDITCLRLLNLGGRSLIGCDLGLHIADHLAVIFCWSMMQYATGLTIQCCITNFLAMYLLQLQSKMHKSCDGSKPVRSLHSCIMYHICAILCTQQIVAIILRAWSKPSWCTQHINLTIVSVFEYSLLTSSPG